VTQIKLSNSNEFQRTATHFLVILQPQRAPCYNVLRSSYKSIPRQLGDVEEVGFIVFGEGTAWAVFVRILPETLKYVVRLRPEERAWTRRVELEVLNGSWSDSYRASGTGFCYCQLKGILSELN
jgi:hypothetical protein